MTMQEARRLAEAGQYREALAILKQIDSPQARRWESQIRARLKKRNSMLPDQEAIRIEEAQYNAMKRLDDEKRARARQRRRRVLTVLTVLTLACGIVSAGGFAYYTYQLAPRSILTIACTLAERTDCRNPELWDQYADEARRCTQIDTEASINCMYLEMIR